MAYSDFSIPFRLAWIVRMQRARFDTRARSLGLTRAQWRLIATVRLKDNPTQSEVAAHLEVSGITASRIVDRLVEKGWIERYPDPKDRRSNRLRLPPGTAPMLEQLAALGNAEEAVALQGFTRAERDTLVAFLDRIIANINSDGADAVAEVDRNEEKELELSDGLEG